MWVNCEDGSGVVKTFAAGEKSDLFGTGYNSSHNSFKPLDLPDGVHMVKIASQAWLVCGLDNQGNLWTWGDHNFGYSDE